MRRFLPFLLLLPLLAVAAPIEVRFADDTLGAAVAEPSLGQRILTAVVPAAVKVLEPVLELLLVLAFAKALTYLHAKEKESKLAKVLVVLTESVNAIVANMLPKIREALADGVLTKAELEALKTDALAAVKVQLPDWVAKLLPALFGGGVESLLKGTIERAIVAQAGVLQPSPASPPSP